MNNYSEQARDGAERALAAALPSDLAGDKKVVRVVRTGAPLSTILDYAKENTIDLIVMGTHARPDWTGLPHVLVGSVAERIEHKSVSEEVICT